MEDNRATRLRGYRVEMLTRIFCHEANADEILTALYGDLRAPA